ncbi:hypothetical protein Rhopal_004878-T1 [Rhodotorula paludigena]|uniref:Phospholipase n=1 Tax=Rhodotorula paludigena TaxID=86838 RepID=A0AAV5GMZ3_9BASI|nr:hypothetical protein Rhopal_004878-T1 [Rhodotorula paludigena]
MDKLVSKLSDKFDNLTTKADRFRESVAFAINPDHRHDEAHEKAEDEARLAIRRENRFESFAPIREGNQNGHNYFWALSEILENAKETIWIAGWWVTPEMWLRRPPAEHPEYRLDRLLLRKAEEGVKIYVMVYKEVTQTMSMSSAHTKHHLEDLHENISVMRHPDHLGGEIVLMWSHHSKIVVVDSLVACIGGLDICFGRWDMNSFPLSDVHLTDFSRSLFAGQDYNNARVEDFKEVDCWARNEQNRLETARMPWSDTHSMITGPAVMDVAQHYVERWNFIRNLKYRHKDRYPVLAFPHALDDPDGTSDPISRHPHLQKFAEIGQHFHVHHKSPDEEGAWPPPVGGKGRKGTTRVQVLCSASDWSLGIHPKEDSIQKAYCQMIAEANHHVHIENQFFITRSDDVDKGPVLNKIGQAIVQRVLSAAKSGEKFKVSRAILSVTIVIPAIPGFAGDLYGNSGTLAILGAQYYSICRGGHSIFELLEREGVNPHDYIEVYNLRAYDRIPNDPGRIKRMEEKSGVTFLQAQAALARVFLGEKPWKQELEKNKVVKFVVPAEGGEAAALDAKGAPAKPNQFVEVPLPPSYDEAWNLVRRFEQGDERREYIADSVAHHAHAGQGSLLDEAWSGDEVSERNAYVTEELYIHSKVMIVDDQRVIMGSANINDRSMQGDRDGEIACVYEDYEDTIPSRMAGKPFMASRFAATLRRQLYKDHLGLSKPESCPPGHEEPVTSAMKPVGVPHLDMTASKEDALVMDPLDPQTESLLRDTAASNAAIFNELFHCVPSADVETWEQPGHIADPSMPIDHIKSQLDRVRGHIVAAPLNFLREGKAPLSIALFMRKKVDASLLARCGRVAIGHPAERLFELSAEVNLATLPIYL